MSNILKLGACPPPKPFRVGDGGSSPEAEVAAAAAAAEPVEDGDAAEDLRPEAPGGIRSARGEGSSSPATNPTPPAKIREAADSALALTDRGRSRWSRAILSRRWRRRRLIVKAASAGGKKIRRRWGLAKKGEVAKAIGGEKVRERLRVLSRLVPGCKRASTPSLLEETADYVAALEMQVRAMRLLADALSAASASANVE
ncbi:hypothetical protein QJS10_CPB12g00605 [Acorus calamus]|uniref:BHLH domain-containing protein n=1 Tax=Acorus calamus TaxID=4465 RepID=A0AAV9DN07_ACOCL|nr:hypothetical protein QJS10_CPB12g00605 [Acorus calamus]